MTKKFVVQLLKCAFLAGRIDLEELIRAFKDLGIDIERTEATKLLQR